MKNFLGIVMGIIAVAVIAFLYSNRSTDPGKEQTTKNERPSNSSAQKEQEFSFIYDQGMTWQTRVEKIKSLNYATLSENDTDTLFQALDHQYKGEKKEDWFVVINEVMEQLRLNTIEPARYTQTMTEILSNAERDTVVRDYAAQQLSLYLTSQEGKALTTEQEKQVLETMIEQIHAPSLAETTVPNTILLSLAHAHQAGISLDQHLPKIKPWFDQTFAQETREGAENLSTIVGAINAASTLELAQYRDLFHNWANDPEVSTSIRLSSIAALGTLATEKEIETLKKLSKSSTLLSHAARSALRNIKEMN